MLNVCPHKFIWVALHHFVQKLSKRNIFRVVIVDISSLVNMNWLEDITFVLIKIYSNQWGNAWSECQFFMPDKYFFLDSFGQIYVT